MDSHKQFTIPKILIATCIVAVLLAIPSHAERITLPSVSTAMWASLIYNAVVASVIAYPVAQVLRQRRLVVVVSLLLYTVNFMPEIITAIDFSLTGDNETTGNWLAQRGLDYDPLVYFPCRFGSYFE